MAELLGPAPIPPPRFAVPPPPASPLPAAVAAHSGLGIASFVLGLFGFVGMFLSFAAAGTMKASGAPMDDQSVGAVLVGLALILMGVVSLLGLGLGIGGLLQRDRRKLFAWLGVGVTAFTVLSTAGLIILGMTLS